MKIFFSLKFTALHSLLPDHESFSNFLSFENEIENKSFDIFFCTSFTNKHQINNNFLTAQ